MNKKQIVLTVVLAISASFLGGSLSSHFVLIQSALAARKSPPPGRITGSEFILVDSEGRTRALLQLETKDLETTLTLFARDEKPKIKFIVDREGNPSAHFWHREAKEEERNPTFKIDRSIPSINFWDSNNERTPYSLPDW